MVWKNAVERQKDYGELSLDVVMKNTGGKTKRGMEERRGKTKGLW